MPTVLTKLHRESTNSRFLKIPCFAILPLNILNSMVRGLCVANASYLSDRCKLSLICLVLKADHCAELRPAIRSTNSRLCLPLMNTSSLPISRGVTLARSTCTCIPQVEVFHDDRLSAKFF